MRIMRASLLSRPRNVAERFPCPDDGKPRVVWAIPGFDLQCGVARPKRWARPIVPPKPKLVIGDGYSCRRDVTPVIPMAGAGFPKISRPSALCLRHRR